MIHINFHSIKYKSGFQLFCYGSRDGLNIWVWLYDTRLKTTLDYCNQRTSNNLGRKEVSVTRTLTCRF